jgi:hypothetical protein
MSLQDTMLSMPVSMRIPELVGCYNDTSKRALSKSTISPVTVDECAKIAAAASSPYFGMQYPEGSSAGRAQCFYGDGLYSKYGATNKCYIKDVSGRPLGGVWANSVYKL